MGGLISCAGHPDRPAVLECEKCHAHLCADCAVHTWSKTGFVDQCPRCQIPLREIPGVQARLQAAAAIPERGPVELLRRVPQFLTFPVNKSVLLVLLGLTIITGPLYWAVGYNIFFLGLIGVVIIEALELSVYFRFVVSTAYGEEEIDPPDLTDIHDDLIAPLGRYMLAFSPCILAYVWYGYASGSILGGVMSALWTPTAISDYSGPATLLLIGLALLPLLTCVAALSGSALAVLNPAIWIQSLRVMGATYVAAALLFYGVLYLEATIWLDLLRELQLRVEIPVLTSAVTLMLSYLPLALRARILGGLCEPYFRDLAD